MPDASIPRPSDMVDLVDESFQFKQIVKLVKENQLITALALFVLWQAGAFVSAYSYVNQGMC